MEACIFQFEIRLHAWNERMFHTGKKFFNGLWITAGFPLNPVLLSSSSFLHLPSPFSSFRLFKRRIFALSRSTSKVKWSYNSKTHTMAKKKNKKNKVGNNESTVADNQVAIVTSALAQISMNEPQRSRNPQTAPVPRATKKTIVAEFQRYFGDESKLENWQRLCKDVGIDEDLPSITKCREVRQSPLPLTLYTLLKIRPRSLYRRYTNTTIVKIGIEKDMGQYLWSRRCSGSRNLPAKSIPEPACTCEVYD